MAVSTAPQPRTVPRDVWHGRYGPALALALVVLPFAAALAWAVSLQPIDEGRLADSISATALDVDDHARVMIRVGERVATAARESAVPDAERASWTAYGEHMVADGRALQELAQRLRTTADVVRTDPTKAWRVDPGMLRSRWEHLRTDGDATAAHGRAMVAQARTVADAGRRLGLVTSDEVAEIERASLGMASAGERIVRIANSLMGSLDQMQRWLGR